MKYFIAIIFLFILPGCAVVNITPSVEKEFERNRSFNQNFEKSWAKAVDWFADNNVTIEKIEKPSGLLTAKYALSADNTFLDCGEIKTSGLLNDPVIDRYGILNVTVREKEENITKVNVNFFGEFTLIGADAWDGRLVTAKGKCSSTGKLENIVLNSIQ